MVVDPGPIRKANLDWRAYALVFVASIIVVALHHVFEPGIKVALLFDGRHYFESSQKACALVLALLSMRASAVIEAEHALRPYVMLDGPILPTLFGSLYACLGRIPASSDWTIILFVQAVLHALAAVLTCKITFQITRRKTVAFVCAALWILYPAALVASAG